MSSRIFLVYLPVYTVFFQFSLSAQQANPYIVNGSAVQENCNCYQLTPEDTFKVGSVWNKNLIDLNQSFNYIFNVFLGCKDADGADGIAFVLQPLGTSIGSPGQGLGFQNVSPSIGIPIDTWRNYDYGDPWYDHIGIYKNGNLVNGSSDMLVQPVQALANSPNIEDCKWHTFRIIWNATTKILSAEIDDSPRVQTQIDLVRDIFNNNSKVYWGFTSATGGQDNIQKFCTSLNPALSTLPDQNFCAPAEVEYIDHSTSFGTILNWWWDLGDGTRFNGQNPPPHLYSQPGYYNVKLNIEANNGCISDTLIRKITIGSIPEAGFNSSPPVICANYPVIFTDASKVQFGTVSQWNWNFNNGAEILQTADSTITKTFPAGNLKIDLSIQTIEGCVSPVISKTMEITPKPATSISVQDGCYGDPIPLMASSLTPSVPIRQWYWFTGDGTTDSGANINHFYPAGGIYPVGVYALNYAGCSSDTMKAEVTIYQSNAKLGNDTIVAFGQPIQLHASGGEFYQWMPGLGLDNSTIADPVAILYDNMQYIVKAYTSFGCPTYDTIQIKAYKGPALYVPNAFTPDNNGHNDYFRPIFPGMQSIDYFEIYNRTGQKVFSSRSASPGWDGTLNGRPQPVGTYVWLIRGRDYQGNVHSESGTVILIR